MSFNGILAYSGITIAIVGSVSCNRFWDFVSNGMYKEAEHWPDGYQFLDIPSGWNKFPWIATLPNSPAITIHLYGYWITEFYIKDILNQMKVLS